VDAYGYIFLEDTENIYYILIGLYLVGMIVVGIVHALRIRTALEYLAAGRDVGFWGTMGTVVATFCGAAAFIGFVGQGYSSGISGFFLWVLPAIFFALIFALCFGRRLRELGIYTLSDAFSLRYGKTAGLFPALIQIFVLAAPMLGVQILGLGVVFHTFFDLSLNHLYLLRIYYNSGVYFLWRPTYLYPNRCNPNRCPNICSDPFLLPEFEVWQRRV
jgi:SSS family solute:Na+ symporter